VAIGGGSGNDSHPHNVTSTINMGKRAKAAAISTTTTTEEVDTNTEAAAAADTNTEPAEPAAAATEETVQPPAKKQATRRLLMKGMSRGELLKKVQEKQEQAPAASSKVIMDVVTFGDIIAIVRFNPDDGYNWFPKVAEGIAFAKAKGLRGFAWEDSSKFATTIT
jgi:hypothetical protein|tara:strand:+ start:186 stop:680 length:495 start_codon:yes stop_codon:yes gene_type:complete